MRLRQSEFFRNALTLVTGSSIAQILPILVAPVLSRIYSPVDYGKVGVFISTSLITGILSTFQYSNAFLLPKEESDFHALVKLCFRNIIISSTSALLILLFAKGYLAALLNASDIENVFLLLPLSMAFTGMNNTLSGFANRRKLFKAIAINRTVAALANISVSLGLGIWLHSWIGLLMGFMINQAVNALVFFVTIYRNTPAEIRQSIRKAETARVRKEYINFPRFSMLTDLINTYTYQIPILLLNIFASPAFVGLYNMTNRILGLPILFISSAVSEVFKQRSSEEFHRTGSCRHIYKKTFKSLSALAILPFLVLIVWGPDLFAFFLGEQWREAGHFARILAPVYLLRFINSPLSFIIYLFKKLKFDLAATIYLNITSFLVLYISLKYFGVNTALMAFSVNYSLIYLFMLSYSNKLSKQSL
jgi:O-antigen/teichoic acid export membrane protein